MTMAFTLPVIGFLAIIGYQLFGKEPGGDQVYASRMQAAGLRPGTGEQRR